jgi:hypothetical protein
MLTPELEAAYRRARYRVLLAEGAIELAIDAASPELDLALAARGVERWGWITAVNPGSKPLDEARNRSRDGELRELLASAGLATVAGEALDPEGRWPVEPSHLVFDVDVERLRELARRFGQIAFVVGVRGAPPRLVATADVEPG